MNQTSNAKIAEIVRKNHERMNYYVPSAWLRMYWLRTQLANCERWGASADMYCLPELPQEMLDRLDGIELEHLGPVAETMGEITFRDNSDILEHFDSAPHWAYVELQEHEFTREAQWEAGSYFYLYSCKTKPNVLYLCETDGESGVWLCTRFGHYK